MSTVQTEIINRLEKITKVKQNADIGSTSWIGCGGSAEILITPSSVKDLQECMKILHENNIPISVIGARSNTIIREGVVSGAVIWLKRGFNEAKTLENNRILAGAGALDYNIAHFAMENGVGNMEFLVGIPGTIGGNIVMNAGCYGGDISCIFESLEYVDFTGKKGFLSKKDINFEYRNANLPKNIIITSSILQGTRENSEIILAKMNEITEKRKKTQPIGRKTVGSTFKNPKTFSQNSFDLITKHFEKDFEHKVLDNSTIFCDKIHSWMLIDAAGLRSHQYGGAGVSEIHCNFLINLGGATSNDFVQLGNEIISKVMTKFGVKLEWEVFIV